MPYKMQRDFIAELAKEFDINKDRFRCYTLESNPQIKIILFGEKEWHTCHIGFLINEHFHVLGLGSFSCINEDAKALYVAMTPSCPPHDDLKLKVCGTCVFNEKEQASIINKLQQIFSKQ